MRRRAAIRLYRFPFFAQIFGLGLAIVDLVSELRSGVHFYLIGFLVGGVVGSAIAVFWFREWKAIEAVSDEQWNRVWFINPSKQ